MSAPNLIPTPELKNFSYREQAALRRSLDFHRKIDYTSRVNPDKTSDYSEAANKLNRLAIKHTVQNQLLLAEYQQDLKKGSMSSDKVHSILNRSHNLSQKRRVEVNTLFEQYPDLKKPHKYVTPKQLTPRRVRTPPVTARGQRISFDCKIGDPFMDFCTSQPLIEDKRELSVKIRPPPPQARSRAAPSRRRTRNSDPPPPRVLIGAVGPSKKHHLFVNQAKLGTKGIIDLDQTDFLEYIIETVENEPEAN